MKKLLMTCLVIVGLFTFLPLFGIISAERIESAYGIELLSSDAIILMRHRALLLGMLGAFVIYSAFVPRYQKLALSLVAINMVGFIFLGMSGYPVNNAISNLMLVDIIGLFFIAVALFAKYQISNTPVAQPQ